MSEQTGAASVACPKGHEKGSFSECFAPFRYCPEKGCGRTERDDAPPPEPVVPDGPVVEKWWETDGPRPYTRSSAYQQDMSNVRDELPPVGAYLDLTDHEVWMLNKILRVAHRHAFYDHDCQTVDCLPLMLLRSYEFGQIVSEAHERGAGRAPSITQGESDV